MSLRLDTIFAPITGPPPAAIAVVRISGSDAWDVASRVFSPWPPCPAARLALYGRFSHGDDGLALPFAEGHSYTGEPAVELSIHGSRASLSALLAACEEAGARPAEPGEFTLRAFLNGRIDLTQAEAVRETVEAETERQLRSANRNREGFLRDEVRGLRAEVAGVLAALEASVDFSEEIGEFDRVAAVHRLAPVLSRVKELGDLAQSGRLLREGLRIAIVGPPNAGKSSLLNALLRADRAIVTSIPGTTRDAIEERASFMGYPVVLVDTAGLRSTEDFVESIGVSRARSAAQTADLIWYVFDASAGLSGSDEEEIRALSRPVSLLANKADLLTRGARSALADRSPVLISALTGDGLPELIASTVQAFGQAGDAVSVNARQGLLLAEAVGSLEDALEHLRGDTPSDLLSVLLVEILDRLGQITGETVGADMLERIFRDFCIGK